MIEVMQRELMSVVGSCTEVPKVPRGNPDERSRIPLQS